MPTPDPARPRGETCEAMRPETWPTEPPKADGYYWIKRDRDTPEVACRSADCWWIAGDDCSHYETRQEWMDDWMAENVNYVKEWRFFPTPLTPAALRHAPRGDGDVAGLLAEEALRATAFKRAASAAGHDKEAEQFELLEHNLYAIINNPPHVLRAAAGEARPGA